MDIQTLFPNALQMQSLADRPVELVPKQTLMGMSVSPAIGTVTVQAAAAVELKVGSSPLADRTRLVIHNPSLDIAVRIGPSSITVKKGYVLEPQETLVIEQEKSVSVPVYGRSMGFEVSLEVTES
jgi:hypothetical protein